MRGSPPARDRVSAGTGDPQAPLHGAPTPLAPVRPMLYASDPQSDDLTHTDDERELEVLSHVHRAQPRDGSAPAQVSQRSIAQALGMSVGLTNAILKRLIDKGFVMMRRINHNNVHYLVTPEGIDQIGKRSYLYLRRTIGHVVRYKERLRAFCHEQKQAGVEEIVE